MVKLLKREKSWDIRNYMSCLWNCFGHHQLKLRGVKQLILWTRELRHITRRFLWRHFYLNIFRLVYKIIFIWFVFPFICTMSFGKGYAILRCERIEKDFLKACFKTISYVMYIYFLLWFCCAILFITLCLTNTW